MKVKYYAKGVKGLKKPMRRLTKETGVSFKRVKNPDKADLYITNVNTYGGSDAYLVTRPGRSSYMYVDKALSGAFRKYAIPHELGHFFGMKHTDDPTQLMARWSVSDKKTKWFSDKEIQWIIDNTQEA